MEQMVQSMTAPIARRLRLLEINGGVVETAPTHRFRLPAGVAGYADAQIDDYGGPDGRFLHRPGATLSLRARFSGAADQLRGTAGFGFWNAPYGDPSRRRPALPRAAWFFFASSPNDLPFAPGTPGRGWFATTIDAKTPAALALLPFAPVVLALNQVSAVRRRLWPAIRRRLGIGAAPIAVDIRQWHDYRLEWRADSCRFMVDNRIVLDAPQAPRGPLGFVCWLDNQYLVLTPRGRFRAGVLKVAEEQWMEVADLRVGPIDRRHASQLE
jgi:hypothetical protein